MKVSLPAWLIFAFGLSLSLPAHAQVNITWSSSAFDLNKTSTGADLDDSFHFAVGGFVGDFDPTNSDPADWANYWVTHGIVQYDTTELFEGFPNNNFLETNALQTNADPFTLTKSPYIWGFNTDGNPSEWILANNPSWAWPKVIAAGGSIEDARFSIESTRDERGNLPTAILGTIRTDTDPEGSPLMTTAAVASANIPFVQSYSEWAAKNFPGAQTETAPNDNPDGDCHTNFLEYAFGSNPVVADHPEAIKAVPAADGSATLDVTLKRSPRADLTAVIQSSTTLQTGSWSNIASTGTTLVEAPGILIIRLDPTLAAEEKLFFRAKLATP